MTPCIRKRGTVVTMCRCDDCRPSNNRVHKRRRNGYQIITGREQAWKRIQTWHARGYSSRTVADMTGLAVPTAQRYYRGVREGRVIPMTQAGVRAVLDSDGIPRGAGWVPATGSARRLQALSAMGWTRKEIRARYGLPIKTASGITSGVVTNIRASTAALIAEAYAGLWRTRGPSSHATATARMRGWHGPLAWDDDIDDPNATPADARNDPTHRFAGRPNADVAEDAAWLLENDGALTTQQAADRLGMRVDSLQQALRRAGEHDMAQRLALNAELTNNANGRRSA